MLGIRLEGSGPRIDRQPVERLRLLRPLRRCRDQPEHAVLGDLGAGQGADDRAIAQDDDPVGALDDLLQLRGDEHDRQPRLGEIADQALDLGLRADVDAAGRIVEQQHPRLEAQDARQQDLLLVAAGELADPLVGARRLDPQAAHQRLDEGVLLALARRTPRGRWSAAPRARCSRAPTGSG